jgi:hypothetical protein
MVRGDGWRYALLHRLLHVLLCRVELLLEQLDLLLEQLDLP